MCRQAPLECLQSPGYLLASAPRLPAAEWPQGGLAWSGLCAEGPLQSLLIVGDLGTGTGDPHFVPRDGNYLCCPLSTHSVAGEGSR